MKFTSGNLAENNGAGTRWAKNGAGTRWAKNGAGTRWAKNGAGTRWAKNGACTRSTIGVVYPNFSEQTHRKNFCNAVWRFEPTHAKKTVNL